MLSPFRIIFLCFIASFFILGIYDMLTNYEKNACDMTYMYEGPSYIPLDNYPAELRKQYPKYNLYIYGEGQYARGLRSGNQVFNGIPVLFIPGNAGSYKQVRSLGSVAYLKAKEGKTAFHFNFFVLDFNEGFSGLYGGVLQEQTEYAHECIKHILSLYENAAAPPKSVLLAGHSMGGMIARGIFTLPDFDTNTVRTIITQATPHQAPVMNVDYYMSEYYEKTNSYWISHVNTTLRDVVILSSSGGYRDVMVRSGLSSLHGLVTPQRGLSVSSMSMQRGWVSTDHLCHVWCKQVVMASTRALFDMVDKNTKQIAKSSVYRMKILHHHFIRNPGPKSYKSVYESAVKLDASVKWEIRQKQSWTFTKDKVDKARYSVMPMPKDNAHSFIAIANIPNENWIGSCKITRANEKCSQVDNLAPYATMLPPFNSDRKVVHLDTDQVLPISYLVTLLPKSDSNIDVVAEVYQTSNREFHYYLPTLVPQLTAYPESGNSTELVVNKTERHAVFYNISIVGLENVLQAYTAHIITRKCMDSAHAGKHSGSVMHFHVPWANEDTFSFVPTGEHGNISLKLQHSRMYSNSTTHARLMLYLNPRCSYKILITYSWMEVFGQFVRFFGVMLPGFCAIQVIMVLSFQLKQLDEEGFAESFTYAHSRYAQPWRVVPLALLARLMLCYPEDNALVQRLGLPLDDSYSMIRRGIWYIPLPIFLYLVSYATVELYAVIVHYTLTVMATISGFFCKSCCMSNRSYKWFNILQYVALVGAFYIAVTVCGALAIAIVFNIYVIKTIYQYLMTRNAEREMKADKSSQLNPNQIWTLYNMNFTLLMMVMLALILNSPALIVWAKDIRYSLTLAVDSSRFIGIIVTLAAMFLNFAEFPRPINELFGILSTLLYMISVAMVLYTIDSVYRVSYFISATLMLVALPTVIIISVHRLNGNKTCSKKTISEPTKKDDGQGKSKAKLKTN